MVGENGRPTVSAEDASELPGGGLHQRRSRLSSRDYDADQERTRSKR